MTTLTDSACGEIKIGLIYGSIREGRFCDTVANWAAGELTRTGQFLVDAIDPRQIRMAAWPEPMGARDIEGLRHRIDRAEAFVVVTPEYNHGYPAALKFLIDSASREWAFKPVALVSYGGASGGLRAIEQLRLVFAELHAITIRDTVSLPHAWRSFDSAGRPSAPEEPSRAIRVMLKSLAWWATVLRQARNATPHDVAAA